MNYQKNILMVYPEFPATYWGMKHALPLLQKESLVPPLGLITIAAMCPPSFSFRLIDLNFDSLDQDDLDWADIILFSAKTGEGKGAIWKEIGKVAI